MPTLIPSPDQAVWFLGPVPVRAYALCLLAGILVAIWWSDRRLTARGGPPGAFWDIAVWAVPFGIVGGRLYHVISSPGPYFGPGGNPLDALKIWEGGLGIWGAIALGALGAWFGARSAGVGYREVATAIAPTLPLAQAIGRWGNWFNNELYGGPTDLPWGLQIHEWDGALGRAVRDAAGRPVVLGTFHPTFLYECLWCLLVVGLLLLLERRLRPRPGQLFGAYVMLYTLGRAVVETLRIDEATLVFGVRLNVWTSIAVFALGAWLWWHWRRPAPSPDSSPDSSAGPTSRHPGGDAAAGPPRPARPGADRHPGETTGSTGPSEPHARDADDGPVLRGRR